MNARDVINGQNKILTGYQPWARSPPPPLPRRNAAVFDHRRRPSGGPGRSRSARRPRSLPPRACVPCRVSASQLARAFPTSSKIQYRYSTSSKIQYIVKDIALKRTPWNEWFIFFGYDTEFLARQTKWRTMMVDFSRPVDTHEHNFHLPRVLSTLSGY